MDARELAGPIVLSLSSVPLFVLAVLVARGNLGLINGLDPARVRDRDALAATLSRLLAGMGLVLLAAAAGFAWAGSDERRVLGATVAMVLAVNALVVWLLLVLARARREYRAPADRRDPGQRR